MAVILVASARTGSRPATWCGLHGLEEFAVATDALLAKENWPRRGEEDRDSADNADSSRRHCHDRHDRDVRHPFAAVGPVVHVCETGESAVRPGGPTGGDCTSVSSAEGL